MFAPKFIKLFTFTLRWLEIQETNLPEDSDDDTIASLKDKEGQIEVAYNDMIICFALPCCLGTCHIIYRNNTVAVISALLSVNLRLLFSCTEESRKQRKDYSYL